MTDLSPRARSVLDDARHADDPTDADRDRVARTLAASLGVAALYPVAAQAATAAGSTAATGSGALAMPAGTLGAGTAVPGAATLVGKMLVTVAVIAAAGLGGSVAWQGLRPVHRGAATRQVPHRGAIPVTVVPTTAEPVAVPRPVAPQGVPQAVSEPIPGPVPSTVHGAAAGVASLSLENQALQRASAALARGDGHAALAELDRYDTTHPAGQLRDEAQVLRVLALCRADRTQDARAVATRFLQAHPDALLADRIRSSCVGPATGTAQPSEPVAAPAIPSRAAEPPGTEPWAPEREGSPRE